MQSNFLSLACLVIAANILASPACSIASPAPPANHSLTPAEYQTMGMAAPDKPWLIPEYHKARMVFDKIARITEHRSQLDPLSRYVRERVG